MTANLLLTLLCGIAAVETPHPPVIDGDLSDPCWDLAVPVQTRFTAFRPRVDVPMSESTVIRVLYDGFNIYFGLHMHDPDPRGIARPLGPRDSEMAADGVTVYLDTFRDGVNCFAFSVSVAGVQTDYRRTEIGGTDLSWDAVWQSAVAVNDSGWTAEIAVPFSVLRYPDHSSQTWGVNFRRDIARTNEAGYLYRMRERGGLDVSLFGELTGLENLPGASSVEWRPFLAGSHRLNTGVSWREDLKGSAGLDIKIPLSMNSVLDVTANPDFGQVEADADQGSISHWAPWLKERRPFFMEGTEIFDMPFSMFYSRSIGSVADDGSVIPVIGGLKLTGVEGGTRYGFLEVVTGRVRHDSALVEPAGSWSAGSVLHEFGPGNWFKFSGTSADFPKQDGLPYFYGRSAAFSGVAEPLEAIRLQGKLGMTWNRDGDNSDNSAVRIDAGYFPEDFEVNLRYQRKGEGFDPGLFGYRQAAGETSWSLYTSGSVGFRSGPVQSAWFGANPYYTTDVRGRNAGSGVGVWAGAVSVERYDLNINAGYHDRWYDRYEGPGGRWYPSGYSMGASASTDYRKPVAGWARANRSVYLDSHTRWFGVGLRLRPAPPLMVILEPSMRLQGAATRYNWSSEAWEKVETDWRSLSVSATCMLTNLMRVRLTGQTSRFERLWESDGEPRVTSRFWANILYSWEYLPGSWLHFLAGNDAEAGEEPTFTVYAKITRFL